jgi:hypothetical protein
MATGRGADIFDSVAPSTRRFEIGGGGGNAKAVAKTSLSRRNVSSNADIGCAGADVARVRVLGITGGNGTESNRKLPATLPL